MKLVKVKEGKIKLSVPEGRIYDASVFYNKAGEMNRDISVSAIQTFQKEFKEKITVCDALSASGARGLRYAKEISGIKEVMLNDKNPIATKLIRKNIKENKLGKKCSVSKEDANMLLRKNVFIVIDIDPFGSPNIFMDSAARSVYHKGFLCVTATDQSALAGTYPNSCFRKYGIKTVRTEFYNELGVRILISFIILNLSRYDRAFVPVLSFADKHYYRVFGRVEHAGRLSDLLGEFKYVSYCSCGNWAIGDKKCSCGKNMDLIGPVYTGSIFDKKFCKKVLSDVRKRSFSMKKQEEKLMNLIIEESEMPPFYYDIHFLAKKFGFKIPKTDSLIKKIESRGFKATRTHFCPTAIKTDAETDALKKILK